MNTTVPGKPVLPAPILLLGDPGLREQCSPVEDLESAEFQFQRSRLHATLKTFRDEHGFGRAISAPQIGVARRFIAINLGNGPLTMINPDINWASPETFTMWDDCMSFPSVLVRLRRHRSISVRYLDNHGNIKVQKRLDRGTSELLQHEIDHLNGILAVDHALDADSLVSRELFEARPDWFAKQGDYVIPRQGDTELTR